MRSRLRARRSARFHLVPVLLLALAAVAVSACGSGSGDSGSGDFDPAGLTGKTYVSAEVTGTQIPGGGPLELSFPDAGTLAAFAGCNRMSGEVTFDGAVMHASDNLVMTQMACPPPRDQTDTWLSDLLREPLGISLDGTTLTVRAGDVSIVLHEVLPTALTGTTWRVTSLVRGGGAENSVALEQAAPWLRIADGGATTGNAGCNTFNTAVTLDDPALAEGTIAFGRVATTRMACDPERTDVENAVLAVLDGEVSYSIEGQELTLTSVADPAIGLHLTATQE